MKRNKLVNLDRVSLAIACIGLGFFWTVVIIQAISYFW